MDEIIKIKKQISSIQQLDGESVYKC
jgi:hypothetical protein